MLNVSPEQKENIEIYRKKYYEANKEHIKQAIREYKETHKSHIIEMHKIYYDAHKINIAEKVKATITCVCGRTYSKGNKVKHLNSLVHKTQIDIPIIAKFFENLVGKNKPSEANYKANDLFCKFQTFLKDGKFKNKVTSTRFGIDIKEYKGIIKTRTKKGALYFIDFDMIKAYLATKYGII